MYSNLRQMQVGIEYDLYIIVCVLPGGCIFMLVVLASAVRMCTEFIT